MIIRKEYGSIIAGAGVAIIILILDNQIDEMPIGIAITGYVFGGLLILYGVVFIYTPFINIWNKLVGIRIRSPLFLKKNNKLTIVTKAINEARLITPTGQDVTVYITDDNGLKSMYAEELRNILLKLQDEKVLIIKTFPDWLLASDKLTKDTFIKMISAAQEPSRENFTISLLSKLKK